MGVMRQFIVNYMEINLECFDPNAARDWTDDTGLNTFANQAQR